MWAIMVGLVKNTKIASIYQYSKPKAYCLPGETWNIQGVDILTTSPFNIPIWPVQEKNEL